MDEEQKQEEALTVQELSLMKTTATALSWLSLISGIVCAVLGVLSHLGLYAGCGSLGLAVLFASLQCSRRTQCFRCTSPCLLLLAAAYLLAQLAFNIYILMEAFDVTKYCYGYMRSQCVRKGTKAFIRCKGIGNVYCLSKYQLALTYTVVGISTFGVMVAAAMLTVLKVVERKSKSSYVGLEVEMKTEFGYN